MMNVYSNFSVLQKLQLQKILQVLNELPFESCISLMLVAYHKTKFLEIFQNSCDNFMLFYNINLENINRIGKWQLIDD